MNHVFDMLEELMVKAEQHGIDIIIIFFSVIALLYCLQTLTLYYDKGFREFL